VKKLVLAIMMMAFCSVGFAQTPGAVSGAKQTEGAALAQKRGPQDASLGSPFTATCSFTFTSGSKNSFLKYCVTTNGNVVQFESPQGHEHIAVFDITEGYGVCDFTNSDNEVAYFDYAGQGDSGNWGPASVVSHSSKSIKIARTTSDGVWTLTQTISQMAGPSPSAQIAMALKNNTAVDRVALLLRDADVDADGQISNNLDSTFLGAFGWNSASGPHPFGLGLESVGIFSDVQSGVALGDPNGPNPCSTEFVPGLYTATDGSIAMLYALNISANSSKTVTVAYRGF